MTYIKRKLSDDSFFITGPDESSIAVKVRGDEARILFSDDDEDLLKLAENQALALGCRKISCDYFSAFRRFNSFLEGNGYETETGKNIIGVNIRDIFASKAVQKSLVIDFPDTDFIPFGELMLYQLEELKELMDKAGIPLTREGLGELDEGLSGIAYDKNRKIRAFILVSAKAEDILIECIYGVSKYNPKYIMTALMGFGKEMIRCGAVQMYEKIMMLEFNDTVRPLVQRLLDGKYEILSPGKILHSAKKLSDMPVLESGLEVREDRISVYEARQLYDREILKRPFQGNINWKADWKDVR